MIPETINRVTRNGSQTFVLVAVETATKADGRTVKFAVWRSRCRQCGELFYVTSPTTKRAINGNGSGLGTVHCPDHRKGTTLAAIARNADFAARYAAEPVVWGFGLPGHYRIFPGGSPGGQ